MHWFARPPWIRWTLSAVLVSTALVAEIRGPATVDRWVAATDIAAGTELTDELFRPVRFPVGLLPATAPTGYAKVDIAAGDPLIAGLIAEADIAVPEDWWTIDLEIPTHVVPGQAVLLVLLSGETPVVVEGIARSIEITNDPFGGRSAVGSVAIPAGETTRVATAAATGNITVLTTNADPPGK